jgi:hypothetical protein
MGILQRSQENLMNSIKCLLLSAAVIAATALTGCSHSADQGGTAGAPPPPPPSATQMQAQAQASAAQAAGKKNAAMQAGQAHP